MENKRDFTPPYPLKTAVLFLIFKRLDTTKKVFEEIKKAKPPRLYVAGDGPRENIKDEEEKVKMVRDYVLNNIDWKCEVKTLFRDKNLGCGKAISEAITWFFQNEEQGIILEDDCIPSQSFFWFCEELLEKYKNEKRIGMISGDNFQDGVKRGDADYYFSIYNHIWGWASWQDRWGKYDFELKTFNNVEFIKEVFKTKKEIKYWIYIFKKMKNREINSWAYQWTLVNFKNKWLTIIPNVNLISNIGFSEDATHTIGKSELENIPREELIIKKHPVEIKQDIEADRYVSKKVFNIKSFPERVIDKFKKFNLFLLKV